MKMTDKKTYDSAGRPIYIKKGKVVKKVKTSSKTKTNKTNTKSTTKREKKLTENKKEEELPEVEAVEAVEVTEVTEETVEVPVEEAEAIIVNDDVDERPTVEFNLIVLDGEEVPEVLEVSSVHIAEEVSEESEEPQAIVVLDDASYEVSDDVELVAVHVDDEDVVVAIDPEVKEQLEDAGVDVQTDLAEAIKKRGLRRSRPRRRGRASAEVAEPVAVELPTVVHEAEANEVAEPVAVQVPAELEHVVELDVKDDQLVIKEVEEEIDDADQLVPVITKDDEDDIVVVVKPQVKDWCKKRNVDVEKDLSFAVIEAQAVVWSYRKIVVTSN